MGESKSVDCITGRKTGQHTFLMTTGGPAFEESAGAEGAITFVHCTSEVSVALWQPEKAPAMSLESVH